LSSLEGCLRQPPERILYANDVEEQGEELFRQGCQMYLEGIVCEPRLSLYRGK
jgi:ATP-dependent DNA ligase